MPDSNVTITGTWRTYEKEREAYSVTYTAEVEGMIPEDADILARRTGSPPESPAPIWACT